MTYNRPAISLTDAQELITVAVAKAAEIAVPMNIVIADESGNVKASVRMDGTILSGYQVAVDKAYSAVAAKTPTAEWYKLAQADPSFAFGIGSIPRLGTLGGGIPFLVAGDVAGGIGVSGGTAAQDVTVAEAAASAFKG